MEDNSTSILRCHCWDHGHQCLCFGCKTGVRFTVRFSISLIPNMSRPPLSSTQLPINRMSLAASPGVKRSAFETERLFPSKTEVNKARCYASISLYIFMPWCLLEHRNRFIFYLLRSLMMSGECRSPGIL
jgi:hypothetical protein